MLSGCGGAVSDEAQITSVINGVSNALSNQNWDKARGYYIYGSEACNSIDDLEDAMAQLSLVADSTTIEYTFSASNISITGDYATVDGFFTLNITANGVSQDESGEVTINLQKVDNSWKIY